MPKGYTTLQQVSLQMGFTISPPPAVRAATLAATGGTGLAVATAYGYALSYVPIGGGETGLSPPAIVITAGSGATQSIALAFDAAPAGVASIRLYRSTGAGAFALLAQLPATVTTFTDTGAIPPSGTPTGVGPASGLPADQQYQVTAILLDATESYIDAQTRRSWRAPPITGERYDVKGPEIFLRQRPIASVERVHTRTVQVGDTGRDLVAGLDYELIDPTLGQLRFANINSDQHSPTGPEDVGAAAIVQLEGAFANALAFVDYTPTGPPVPADISLCATLIVAASLYRAMNPDRVGIRAAEVEQGVKITYSQDGTEIVIPEMAQRILDRSVLPILV